MLRTGSTQYVRLKLLSKLGKCFSALGVYLNDRKSLPGPYCDLAPCWEKTRMPQCCAFHPKKTQACELKGSPGVRWAKLPEMQDRVSWRQKLEKLLALFFCGWGLGSGLCSKNCLCILLLTISWKLDILSWKHPPEPIYPLGGDTCVLNFFN